MAPLDTPLLLLACVESWGLLRQGSLHAVVNVGLVQASLAVDADLNNDRLVREGRLDRLWIQPLVGSQDLSGNAQLGA